MLVLFPPAYFAFIPLTFISHYMVVIEKLLDEGSDYFQRVLLLKYKEKNIQIFLDLLLRTELLLDFFIRLFEMANHCS